ncbi:MAG: hypothetical protein ABIH11_03900 [Candidatus Altiarchaeota archaeon]
MSDGEDWLEERYIGNRRFRRMADGRTVEVTGDGSLVEDFRVEGRDFSSYGADFESISNAYEPRPLVDESKPVSGSASSSTAPMSKEDRIKEYIRKKSKAGKDSRLDAFKVSHSGVHEGGTSHYLSDDMPKAHTIGGSHRLSSSHDIRGGTGMFSTKQDPLKDILDKRKAESYREHMEKVFGKKASESKSFGGFGVKSSGMDGNKPLLSKMMSSSKSKRDRSLRIRKL